MTENGPRREPDVMLEEAASLFYLLGGMGARHLVLVGGLVPPLLVTTPFEPHGGSADIDLCLSVAITEGATREYYKAIEAKIAPYFEPVPRARFRWRKKSTVGGVPLVVDFLAPEGTEGTVGPDGERVLDDETAAENTGWRLRPFAISSGALIDRDAMDRELDDVYLVYSPGEQATVRLRHAGPVGFLAAKAAALENRAEHKDGYDVSWWCINAAATPAEVAALVTERPAFADELVVYSIAMLKKAYKRPTYPGPHGYAKLSEPDAAVGSDAFESARNLAYVVVGDVLEELEAAIDWDEIAAASS